MARRSLCLYGVVGIVMLIGGIGCLPAAPDECGENVETVVSIDFTGPEVIEVTPGFDSAVYIATATIEKVDQDEPALLCFLVRDDDWGVDDFLVGGSVFFSGDETTASFDGFRLFADDQLIGLFPKFTSHVICGDAMLGGMPDGCSGEASPSVYLDPFGSGGADSPKHTIRSEPSASPLTF